MDFYSLTHRQDRTIESDCAAVCNQFSVAHVLSHLSEYERQRFLLFIQHNVDTAGKWKSFQMDTELLLLASNE